MANKKFMKNKKRNRINPPAQDNPEEQTLSQIKIEQLSKQPILETRITKSEDGKWILHKTIITDIKPVSYFEKVLD